MKYWKLLAKFNQDQEQQHDNSNNGNDVSKQELNGQSQQDNSSNENVTDKYDANNDKEVKSNVNKEKLEELRDKIKKYSTLKNKQIRRIKNNVTKDKPNLEAKKVELSEENRQFISKLEEIFDFNDREKNDGYVIDTSIEVQVSESIIRTLITKFLDQRFNKKDTDLNIRSNSFERSQGFYRWDTKAVVTHTLTHQITKVLIDKYGYKYADGKNESVPLSFYFDLSGSMKNYTSTLSVIALELLKRKVKVLVGFNEVVDYQIDSISNDMTVDDFALMLNNYQDIDNKKIVKKIVNRNIDDYLLSAKAEKCVIFSDFDPLDEVINLSKKCKTYWFCYEKNIAYRNVENFNGFLYQVNSLYDIAQGLIKINSKRFETLIYLEQEKILKKGGYLHGVDIS